MSAGRWVRVRHMAIWRRVLANHRIRAEMRRAIRRGWREGILTVKFRYGDTHTFGRHGYTPLLRRTTWEWRVEPISTSADPSA